jgi:hypothetical protein
MQNIKASHISFGNTNKNLTQNLFLPLAISRVKIVKTSFLSNVLRFPQVPRFRPFVLTLRVTSSQRQKSKYLSVQSSPISLEHSFWKIHTIWSFVLLVRVTCRWISVWSTGRMTMTGKKLSIPSATLPTINLTRTGLGSNPSTWGERLAINRQSHGRAMKINLHCSFPIMVVWPFTGSKTVATWSWALTYI